jgi:hypothetical protein
MALNPAYKAHFTMLDVSGEASGIKINVDGLMITYPNNTLITNFLTSVAAVSDGLITTEQLDIINKLSNAAVGAGNREDKWLVGYHDDTTLADGHFTIPCRKNTLPVVSGTDRVDLTASPWATFKTNVEALVLSPDGNSVTVDYVQLVGRNI